ncbi:MAG: nucleotidyl transferase AbiEii/AbiGii toxin family protein [Bryobacterales bacterium]|nr:nucleotidyl transferase AbiEii/AbiGii toxin family protein [Bryobacterales bacterium]
MAANSRIRRGLRLTPHQELHERLMWDVLVQVQNLGLVLKGGTALAFTRGLDRHSTDLDFDAGGPVELRDRIDSSARSLGASLEPASRRDWPGRQRFLASYPPLPGDVERLFKVHVRHKTPPEADDIEIVGGIRTYKVPALFDQKMAATGSRIEARDVFDLAFVMERYGDTLRDDQIRRADAFTADLNRLERRYKDAFERDDVLRGVSDVEDSVVRFRYATTDQFTRRWPQIQEQRIPIPTDVLSRVVAIQDRARMASGHVTEPQHSRPSTDKDFLRSPWNADRKGAREKEVDLDWSISR